MAYLKASLTTASKIEVLDTLPCHLSKAGGTQEVRTSQTKCGDGISVNVCSEILQRSADAEGNTLPLC